MQTLFLILLPLFSAFIVFLFRNEKTKVVAFVLSLAELGLGLATIWKFDAQKGLQFVLNTPWIASAGIRFSIGIDGISVLMILLTVLLTPIIILSGFGQKYERPNVFYGLILLMQSALVGVFVAQDGILYYLFWEAALIPIYFICAIWGGENRIRVTFKFFIYTVFGSLLMLIALVYMYMQNGNNASAVAFSFLRFDVTTQTVLFWALFVAFAIKMPLFPFHTWQPDTYTESPAPATMLLSGIMLKMGIYSLLRWLIPVLPLASKDFSDWVVLMGIIGIVYGSIIAIQQRDMKRLLAYSSFAHVGLMAAGIFSFTQHGIQGALIQMLSHGVNVVGLFYIVQLIENRTQTRIISELGGLSQKAPVLTVFFAIFMLGSVALPLTNGFIGEFLLLWGMFNTNIMFGFNIGIIPVIVAGTTIVFGAVYMLKMFQNVMFGETTPFTENANDLTFSEVASLVPLVVMVFWIGLYPNSFLSLTEPSVDVLLLKFNNVVKIK